MGELIATARVAEITGFTVRWVQMHAAMGKIPGAKRLGGHWRFDEAAVRRWVEAGEVAKGPEWQPSTKGAKSGMADSSISATSSVSRLKQLLAQ